MKNSSSSIGKIHSIDTYSTLDGFGIRSVIFMQGCDLRCIYCHNPDTWCMANGIDMTADEIVEKISHYKSYYGANGGVTFGGGEPLLQVNFINTCVDKLSDIGVKACIETSGNVELTPNVKKLLKKLDFVICDLKFVTSEDYLRYTGGDLNTTLAFLEYLDKNNIPVWARTVIVTGINDNDEFVKKAHDILSGFSNIIRYELLPLSKLGFSKYEKLGIVNRIKDIESLDMDKFKKLQEKYEIKPKQPR